MDTHALAWAALVPVGAVAAAFSHEMGHAVAGALVGVRPRVINLGIGRPLLRWRVGRTWVVVRLKPTTGWVVTEAPDRRWAWFVVAAGGPLANVSALAVIASVAALHPAARGAWLAFGTMQLAFLLLTLWPRQQKIDGHAMASDGLALFRVLVRPWRPDLGRRYATLLQPFGPPGDPQPSPSRHLREILYLTHRADRWLEDWARHDTIAGFRALLDEQDLSTVERTYVLVCLVTLVLLATDADRPSEGFVGSPPQPSSVSELKEAEWRGSPAAVLLRARLDDWSRTAMALSPGPLTASARGAVLGETGASADGLVLLLRAEAELQDRGPLDRGTAALFDLFIGRALAAEARHAEHCGAADAAREVATAASLRCVAARRAADGMPALLMRDVKRLATADPRSGADGTAPDSAAAKA